MTCVTYYFLIFININIFFPDSQDPYTNGYRTGFADAQKGTYSQFSLSLTFKRNKNDSTFKL